MKGPVLLNMRRRLERWELHHLRQLAAQLHERLEAVEAELAAAREQIIREQDYGEFWHRQASELQDQIYADGGAIGLTQEGQLFVLSASAEPTMVEAH